MKGSIIIALSVSFLVQASAAQVTLTGTSYLQTFDTLDLGLAPGWSLYTGADSTSLGSAEAFSPAAVAWSSSSGAFKNFASAHNAGVSDGDSATVQLAYGNRALGVRQTGSFGDPGAAFVFELADTKGLFGFDLSVDLQMLSVQNRSTTWSIDYRLGTSGPFSEVDRYSDPGVFGSTTRGIDFGTALDDQVVPVFIRVAALEESTGGGSRDSLGIDNFELTFTPVPEPQEYGLVAALTMLGYAAWRRRNRGRIKEPIGGAA